MNPTEESTKTIERQSNPNLWCRSMLEGGNESMPADEVIAEKVKELLADKVIYERFQILYYLFDRGPERLIEFWIRYSYDTQFYEKRDITGWEPLPQGDFKLLEPIKQYYWNYFNDDRMSDTGKLGGNISF